MLPARVCTVAVECGADLLAVRPHLCACVRLYIYISTHAHTYWIRTHASMCTYTRIHTQHTQIRTHTYRGICIHIYAYIYMYICIYTHTDTYTCIYQQRGSVPGFLQPTVIVIEGGDLGLVVERRLVLVRFGHQHHQRLHGLLAPPHLRATGTPSGILSLSQALAALS